MKNTLKSLVVTGAIVLGLTGCNNGPSYIIRSDLDKKDPIHDSNCGSSHSPAFIESPMGKYHLKVVDERELKELGLNPAEYFKYNTRHEAEITWSNWGKTNTLLK